MCIKLLKISRFIHCNDLRKNVKTLIYKFLDINHNAFASCIQSYYAKIDALPKMSELDLKVCLDDREASLIPNFTNDCLIVKRVINIYPIRLGIYQFFSLLNISLMKILVNLFCY